MANPQTQPQQQPPPTTATSVATTTTSVISGVAAALASSLTPLLAYAAIEPLLEGFELATTALIARKALRAALLQTERFPQPVLAGIGTAQRNMVTTNAIRRAAYVVSATRRIAHEIADAKSHGESEEQGLSEAVSRENVYFLQHVNADAERIASATTLDAVSAQYGDIVGWYANDDERVTPECREANGKNFRVSDPPAIGYPGSTHVSCRCYPGPPHPGAEMLASPSAPILAIAASNLGKFDVAEFTQQLSDYYQVRIAFTKPREQVSKKSVNYRKATPGAEHRCGNCVMYRASRCDLVEGYIVPTDVCDKWEAKPDTVDLIFVPGPDTGPNVVRHVRSARGVAFFNKPVGSPITEAEYQELLAARRAAREANEPGHPDRLAAERAVRQARKTRGSGVTSSSGGDPVANEVSETQRSAQEALNAVKLQAEVTGKTSATPKSSNTADEIARLRQRLSDLEQGRAGRETGQKANLASRVDDKRIAQGQTKSAFEHPNGKPMSKSEIGDTYEQLFSTHGAPLLEKIFGRPYEMISHANGGARNTPLDFRLGHTYGGELKTMSAGSEAARRGKLKTAIKKEEIDRKLAAVAREGLKPLLVVQVVDQANGKVDIYTHDAFASKFVKSMRHVGTYNYTHADFHDANVKAGYGQIIRDASSPPPKLTALEGDKLWQSDAGRKPGGYTAEEARIARELWYGESYDHIQSRLRTGEPFDLGTAAEDSRIEKELQQFRRLTRSTPPLKQPITTHRGVRQASAIFGPVGSKLGEAYTDQGFQSTSAKMDTALGYGRQLFDPESDYTVLHYEIPAGAHVLRGEPEFFPGHTGTSPKQSSLAHQEFTLPDGTTAIVRQDYVKPASELASPQPWLKPDDRIRHIHVSVVPAPVPPKPDEGVARLTPDEEYQRLIDARLQAKKMYPPGHPERVKAERAVRQARRTIHGGTPAPKPPTPKASAPKERYPGANEDYKIIGEAPKPTTLDKNGAVGSGVIRGRITHGYRWSTTGSINQVFQAHAERSITRALDHHSKLVPSLFTNDSPIDIRITKTPSVTSGALGSYGGSSTFGRLNLHPKIFDHVIEAPGGRKLVSAAGGGSRPDEILYEAKKSGWWVPTDSKWTLSDNVIGHEIGHGLNDAAFERSGNNLGIPNSSIFWHEFSQLVGVPEPKSSEVYTPKESFAPNEVSTNTSHDYTYSDIANWIAQNRVAIHVAVSEYGADLAKDGSGKPREMFAELWNEFALSSNPRPLAKFYGQAVQQAIKERNVAHAAEEKRRAGILRDLPADIRGFSPSQQDVGNSVTLSSLDIRVTRTGTNNWEIMLLGSDGSFRGAYGRRSAAEVSKWLKEEWIFKQSGTK